MEVKCIFLQKFYTVILRISIKNFFHFIFNINSRLTYRDCNSLFSVISCSIINSFNIKKNDACFTFTRLFKCLCIPSMLFVVLSIPFKVLSNTFQKLTDLLPSFSIKYSALNHSNNLNAS
ncbi:hypothetical protein NCER_102529 [Vairimorpha ceranae BRL01]|uniref:Uncharacterized protein n=1 Tax=Vairimorpha ceranae (strain BRL01) TaxID=578460 RepID=C4VC60_VAIC1|nr:hypothetical protein NCER_102529 [Vairimorpha ceranae BRL01]